MKGNVFSLENHMSALQSHMHTAAPVQIGERKERVKNRMCFLALWEKINNFGIHFLIQAIG